MAKAKISDFIPQQRNANRHTQRGLGMLEKSMADNGFIGALTSAADGEIFDGSARLEVAYDRFGEEVEPIVIDADGTRPIIVRRTDIPSANDPKAKKLAIAANRIAQVDLDWDPELLKAIGEDIDISDLFFDNEIERLFEQLEKDSNPNSPSWGDTELDSLDRMIGDRTSASPRQTIDDEPEEDDPEETEGNWTNFSCPIREPTKSIIFDALKKCEDKHHLDSIGDRLIAIAQYYLINA